MSPLSFAVPSPEGSEDVARGLSGATVSKEQASRNGVASLRFMHVGWRPQDTRKGRPIVHP
ncbi:hypothetical protein SAMD00023353_9500050 [Rosellinia necatrix]|uniref:Uncharacterized protein n=1 Tax=Rosellinia necatrix TaxID=77044 RepID=A0A1S8AAW5_ROSNE|nr:hypothetical protein SAMD00023353_9500050 [Rosellinia necatrix]